MTSVTYHGHVTMTYPHYIDLATGKTLVCQPGQTYNVAPASGSPISAGTMMPNDGRFATGNGANMKTPKKKAAVSDGKTEDAVPAGE